MIKAGKYLARIVDYGIPETDKEHPQAAVRLAFETERGVRELTWYGSFHPNAVEITVDTLINCGLKGTNPAALLNGPDGGALDMERELEIGVEPHTYNGKTYDRVKWIGLPGGLKFTSMTPEKAQHKLAGLSAFVASRKRELGAEDDESDVGF